MTASLDMDAVMAAFDEAGYDANLDEVLVARRDEVDAIEVIVDRGGRVKATISRLAGQPSQNSLEVNGRPAAVLTERHTIITVMFALQDAGEMAALLTAIEEL